MGRPLLDLALREGLLTESEVAAWPSHPRAHYNFLATKCIRRVDQPFALDLTVRKDAIVFAPTDPSEDEEYAISIRTGVHHKWVIGQQPGLDYTTLAPCFSNGECNLLNGNRSFELIRSLSIGHLVCHLEVQSLDDQGEPDEIVLRIDRILEPAVQVSSLPILLPRPMPGELYALPSGDHKSGLKIRPWMLRLSNPRSRRFARNFRALYAAQHTEGDVAAVTS